MIGPFLMLVLLRHALPSWVCMKSLCLERTPLGLLHSCKAMTHFYCMTTNVSRLSLKGQRQQYVTEDNTANNNNQSTCPRDIHSVCLCTVWMSASGSIQLRQIHFKRSLLYRTLFPLTLWQTAPTTYILVFGVMAWQICTTAPYLHMLYFLSQHRALEIHCGHSVSAPCAAPFLS